MSADITSLTGIPTYHHHHHHQGHGDHSHSGAELTFRPTSSSAFSSPSNSAGFQQPQQNHQNHNARASSPDSRPSTASSAADCIRDASNASNPTSSAFCDRPGSRQSSFASLSTPASTTSSIFPSNNSNATTTTSTSSLTAKSSGMSSPASTSEQCFTPATSTATTSPSSAPHALGVNVGLEGLAQKGMLHHFSLAQGQVHHHEDGEGGEGFGAVGSGEGRKSDGSSAAGGEALWMRRQKAFEEAKRTSQRSAMGSHHNQQLCQQHSDNQGKTASFTSSSSPWNPKLETSVSSLAATEREHSSSSPSSTMPPYSLGSWAPGSGLNLPPGLLGNSDSRPWSHSHHNQQDSHLSSGAQSISSTAASSPQQRWFAMGGSGGGGDNGNMEKGDGSLGLSMHTAFSASSSSSGSKAIKKATSPGGYPNGPPPALMTTPSSPTGVVNSFHLGAPGMDIKSHLDSLKFALQNYDATSAMGRHRLGGGGAAVDTTQSFSRNHNNSATLSQQQQGLGFDPVHTAPGNRRGFVGRGIGNGVRSDGVWSASVSPSMMIQPLPLVTSAAAAAFGGGSTPVPGAVQRGGAGLLGLNAAMSATTSSSSSSATSTAIDPAAISRPRSAAAAVSAATQSQHGGTGGDAGVAVSSPGMSQAQFDQFLASANFLERLASAQRGRGGEGGSGAVTPDERMGGGGGGGGFAAAQNELASVAQQQNQDIVAAAAAAAVAALGVPSLGHNHDHLGRSNGGGALGLTTSAQGNGSALFTSSAVAPGRLALFTSGQGSPSMSAPASAFGSPVTFHAPLMQMGDSGQGGFSGSVSGGPSPNNRKLNLYKTELCRNWEEKGTCRYGVKCQYAHGQAELRPVQRHSKYKTEICRTFWRTGSCPYAKRCCFIHTTAADTTGMEFASPSLGPNAPLLARVSGDRQSQHGNSGTHASMPNSPLVTMNRGLTGNDGNGTGAMGNGDGKGAEHANGVVKKADPLALSSLSDALAGFNLGGPGPVSALHTDLSSSRFRHQSSASMGGNSGSMGPSFSGSSHHGHGYGQGNGGHGLGTSALGGGPRFFKGPVQ
ncbi:hypothetical protein CF319_g3396 [Tilletia indica]|nr:hypothetical protein CF319_g3396 [Tilletia indica]